MVRVWTDLLDRVQCVAISLVGVSRPDNTGLSAPTPRPAICATNGRRAGAETALRRVVVVFGAARPQHAYLSPTAMPTG